MVGHLFQNSRYTILFEMCEVRSRLVLVRLRCCILLSRLAFSFEIGIFIRDRCFSFEIDVFHSSMRSDFVLCTHLS